MTLNKHQQLLGALIIERRRKFNLTQSEVAKAIGCSESYVCKLELGYMKKPIQLDRAMLLARALRMTFAEFAKAIGLPPIDGK